MPQAGSAASASATPAKRYVQSRPLRDSRRTAPLVDARGDAVAVVLDLVQPAVAARRLLRPASPGSAPRWSARGRPAPARAPSPALAAPLFARPARLRGAAPAAISSMVRPVETLRSSAPHGSGSPGRASSSRSLMSSHWFSSLVPGAPRVHQHPAAAQPLAGESDLELALLEAARARRRPAPRCPCPRASPCRRRTRPWGWCPRSRRTPPGGPPRATARRRTLGSRLGPLGTAQLSEHAVELEPQVVVQAAGGVLLDAVAGRRRGVRRRRPAAASRSRPPARRSS